MNIAKPAILHTEESDGWGGQEIRIFNEMLGMKARGYEVMLAAPSHAKLYSRALQAGIETFPVQMKKGNFINGVFEISRIIKQRRIGIINTHSSRDSWIGSIAARLSGAKVIRTRHISSELKKDILTRFLYGQLCDAIITTGDFIRNQITGELGIESEKVYSIPTGIAIDKFNSADGINVRAELGFEPADIVLGTAAALRSWKGHEFLIKAMPIILKEYPEVKMVFAGEGPMRGKIEQWIEGLGVSNSVFLLGHREDVAEVIKAFDISLLVSYASEGIPQFVLQSMAAGKPVIGTTVGGIPEVVKDGINGVIIPPKDPKAIAGAVKNVLSVPGRREEMGKAGYNMTVENHSFDTMLDRLEVLYRKISL